MGPVRQTDKRLKGKLLPEGSLGLIFLLVCFAFIFAPLGVKPSPSCSLTELSTSERHPSQVVLEFPACQSSMPAKKASAKQADRTGRQLRVAQIPMKQTSTSARRGLQRPLQWTQGATWAYSRCLIYVTKETKYHLHSFDCA